MSVSVLILGNSCSDTEDTIPRLNVSVGDSMLDIENFGYEVQLDASLAKEGQLGQWSILRGDNGIIEDANNPESMFSGEPGEIYTLQWTISEGAHSKSDIMDVSFKALDPSFEVAEANQMIADTLKTSFTLSLDANGTKYGGEGHWSYQVTDRSDDNLVAEDAYFVEEDSCITKFVGMPNTAYEIKWKVAYGSKEDSTTFNVVFDSLRADAGGDQLYNLAYGDGLLYGTLYPNHQEGASVKWSILENPENGRGRLHNDTDANSLFEGEGGAVYKLRFELSHGGQTDADTILYAFNRHHLWTDTDGQTYRTVKVNGLEWMAENYNMVVPFSDPSYPHSWYFGVDKYGIIENSDSTISMEPVMSPEDRKYYGRLYSYIAAEEMAPEGWRLPTGDELLELFNQYGGTTYAGTELKEGGGTGIDLVFGGMYVSYTNSTTFYNLNLAGYYWYQHDGDDPLSDYINVMTVSASSEAVFNSVFTWGVASSVRYVRDIQE